MLLAVWVEIYLGIQPREKVSHLHDRCDQELVVMVVLQDCACQVTIGASFVASADISWLCQWHSKLTLEGSCNCSKTHVQNVLDNASNNNS